MVKRCPTARTYLNYLDPQYLRYYFAAKLSSGVDDIDLNFEDFSNRVNSDLVGKVVNIASRCAGFIEKKFNGKLSDDIHDQELFSYFVNTSSIIEQAYEKREFSLAMREIMLLADRANQYIDEHKPWIIAKQENGNSLLQSICTMGLNCFRQLMVYLKPVLPIMAKQAEQFLNITPLQWQDVHNPLVKHKINKFVPLIKRVTREEIDQMIEYSKEDLAERSKASTETEKTGKSLSEYPVAATITIDDFSKIDLRVARIIKADHVDGADKLLKLTLDIGGETRSVFAGIKAAYQPEELEGRLTVMVVNLTPRKMQFGTSEGMVLAAGPGGKELFILNPDTGAEPGMKIK
jgi:methionyl-tRNA synthetase